MTSFDASSKVWSGPKVDRTEDDKLSFRELLFKSFQISPEKVFQVSDDEQSKLTFRDTELISIRVCQNLTKFGIHKNDVVTILLKNSTYAAPLVFGCILNGTAVHSLAFLQGMSRDMLTKSLEITKPKAIIVEQFLENTEMIAQTIADMNLECKVFTVGSEKSFGSANVHDVRELLKETKEEDKFELSSDGVNDDTIVFVIPSSGSSGPPKAIATNGAYWKLTKDFWIQRDQPVVFCYSNLSWLTGAISLFFPLFNNGTRIISKENFSTKHYGTMARTYKATSTITSVESVLMMLKSLDFSPEDFTSMKEFICGGERIPRNVRDFLKPQLPHGSFNVAYGSTEAGVITSFENFDDTSDKNDNVIGGLRSNVQCMVVDIESRKALGIDEVGEIYVKAEKMFSEYYGNNELTVKAFDKDWYKMGDVGYFDRNNRLHVYGRAKDMIQFEGKKIHPANLENIFEDVDGVREACVVSVEEKLAVLVTKLPNSNLTEAILEIAVLDKFKTVQFKSGLYIVDKIPRTNSVSCKIQRDDAKVLVLELMKQKT